MQPDTMRTIDFWAGIPLSFLVTLWYTLMRRFGLKNPRFGEEPHEVLFIELAEMGSTILAYPALKKFRELFPNARIHFLLFRHIKATADVIDLIPRENVLTIDSRNIYTLLRDTVRVMTECRRRKIDTVINLEMFARYSALLTYLSGARRRVGFHRFLHEGLYTGNFLTHNVPYNPHIHTAHSFISLVRALADPRVGVDEPLGKYSINDNDLTLPTIETSVAGRERIRELIRSAYPAITEQHHIVILNPNASKLIPLRKWPLENYALLAKNLVKNDSIVVALTGVESEWHEAEYIRAAVGSERIINLAGKTTLQELIDFFNIADILVTNDSGPAHFASLTNIHIIVFFGPETPALYKPLSKNCTVLYSNFSCSPCVSATNQRRTPCNSNKCLKIIEVESVYRQIEEVLTEAKK